MPKLTDKEKWLKSLSVGDTVCDCRFKHLQIRKICEVWIPVTPSHILWKIMTCKLWPLIVFETFYNIYNWVNRKLGRLKLADKDLILEDGQSCSAVYCCDPVDHEWKHPE